MIKPWMFEFLQAPAAQDGQVSREIATAVFDKGIALWKRLDTLGFEGIFFSEHHFGLSYSPSPNLLIAAIAQSTERLRLGTMGVVLPLYQPWRVLEEIGMLDHLTGGRLEIGCASGVPQELIQTGIGPEENRERFNEALEILGGVEGVGIARFSEADVVRHPLVGRIVAAYNRKDARR